MTVPTTIRLPSLSVWNSLCPCPTSPPSANGKQTEANPLMRIAPGYPASQTFSILFEAALNRTFEELENWKRGDDLRPLLDTACRALLQSRHPRGRGSPASPDALLPRSGRARNCVRMTLHNIYRECKGFGTRNSMTAEQDTAFRLEEFMNRRYEFRYNTVLGELEYRQRDSIHFQFRPADQRIRSSISAQCPKRRYPGMGPRHSTLPLLAELYPPP